MFIVTYVQRSDALLHTDTINTSQIKPHSGFVTFIVFIITYLCVKCKQTEWKNISFYLKCYKTEYTLIGSAGLLPAAAVFFTGSHTAPDMPLGLVLFKHLAAAPVHITVDAE